MSNAKSSLDEPLLGPEADSLNPVSLETPPTSPSGADTAAGEATSSAVDTANDDRGVSKRKPCATTVSVKKESCCTILMKMFVCRSGDKTQTGTFGIDS